jgi:hypothetical protein
LRGGPLGGQGSERCEQQREADDGGVPDHEAFDGTDGAEIRGILHCKQAPMASAIWYFIWNRLRFSIGFPFSDRSPSANSKIFIQEFEKSAFAEFASAMIAPLSTAIGGWLGETAKKTSQTRALGRERR